MPTNIGVTGSWPELPEMALNIIKIPSHFAIIMIDHKIDFLTISTIKLIFFSISSIKINIPSQIWEVTFGGNGVP